MSWHAHFEERERRVIAARFSSLSAERRAELEMYVLPHLPEANRPVDDCSWEHEVEEAVRNLPPEAARLVKQQMFADAFDVPDLDPPPEFAPEYPPRTPLEHAYIEWRCTFLTEIMLEETASLAAHARADADRALECQASEIANLQSSLTISHSLLASSVKTVLVEAERNARGADAPLILPQLSEPELILFLFLIGGRLDGERIVPYDLRTIARSFYPPISHTSVARYKKALFAKYPPLEAFHSYLTARTHAAPARAFSRLSPIPDESADDDAPADAD